MKTKYTSVIVFLLSGVLLLGVSFPCHSAIFTVTSNADAGVGTLRQAILDANSVGSGSHNINFNITTGSAPFTILLASTLPTPTTQVIIDGTTQSQYSVSNTPVIVLDGSAISACCWIFMFNNTGGEGSVIRGLVIDNNANGHGIEINGVNSVIIEGCYIGTDVTGKLDKGNKWIGIKLYNTNDTKIGGTSYLQRNVISGNDQFGIHIDNSKRVSVINNFIGVSVSNDSLGNSIDGVFVLNSSSLEFQNNVISGNKANGIEGSNADSSYYYGNYIGTDSAGAKIFTNGAHGLYLYSGSNYNWIGGISSDSSNLISGNTAHGIFLDTDTNNFIVGNKIGTNLVGTSKLGNKSLGINISSSPNIYIGPSNLISGNGTHGIQVMTNSDNLTIEGNFIGTDITGMNDLGNTVHGIYIDGSKNILIGGNTAANRNIIAANGAYESWANWNFIEGQPFGNGMEIDNCTNGLIEGNYVGLSATGTGLGNKENGISIETSSNMTIQDNVVSGNQFQGIVLFYSDNCSLKGNFVGTDPSGKIDVGNGLGYSGHLAWDASGPVVTWYGNGLLLTVANYTTIGGSNASDLNIFSGNGESGISTQGSSHNIFQGNYIGVDINQNGMGNDMDGIRMQKQNSISCDSNYIGGINPGEPNVIAYNKTNGIDLADGNTIKNQIRRNSIYCNTLKGIELNGAGNENYSTPLGAPTISANATDVSGTATPNSIIEVFTFDGTCPGCSQGKDFIGTTNADGSGTWTITVSKIPINTKVSYTATEPGAGITNTSEFSTCATVLPVKFISFSATATGESSVELNWLIASEINNNYFLVQRSSDGVHFETISKVKAENLSVQPNAYYFYDNDPSIGGNFYRLSPVDIDGKSSFSGIIYINIKNDGVISLFPNPYSDIVTITSTKGEILWVRIFDITGKLCSEVFAGENFTKTGGDLEPGVYIFEVNTDQGKNNYKVIKTH